MRILCFKKAGSKLYGYPPGGLTRVKLSEEDTLCNEGFFIPLIWPDLPTTSKMVNQKYWDIKNVSLEKKACFRLKLSLMLDLLIEVMDCLRKKAKLSRHKMNSYMHERRHVYEYQFSFNSLSTQKCLCQFIFSLEDMKRILSIFNYHGSTQRQSYVCSEITAACILIKKISYPYR